MPSKGAFMKIKSSKCIVKISRSIHKFFRGLILIVWFWCWVKVSPPDLKVQINVYSQAYFHSSCEWIIESNGVWRKAAKSIFHSILVTHQMKSVQDTWCADEKRANWWRAEMMKRHITKQRFNNNFLNNSWAVDLCTLHSITHTNMWTWRCVAMLNEPEPNTRHGSCVKHCFRLPFQLAHIIT